MMIDTNQEGYIKFSCNFNKAIIDISKELFTPLNYWRNFLRGKGWIGSYPDGIGFGNISIRIPGSNQFYISGSATGGIADLGIEHYALVERCDPAKNMIWCKGLIKASAESMSHYMIYETLPETRAVVHIHNMLLWNKYLELLPATAKEVSYGTPEMAFEIARVLKLLKKKPGNAIVMGGHEEGIISFGTSVEEAVKEMLKLEGS